MDSKVADIKKPGDEIQYRARTLASVLVALSAQRSETQDEASLISEKPYERLPEISQLDILAEREPRLELTLPKIPAVRYPPKGQKRSISPSQSFKEKEEAITLYIGRGLQRVEVSDYLNLASHQSYGDMDVRSAVQASPLTKRTLERLYANPKLQPLKPEELLKPRQRQLLKHAIVPLYTGKPFTLVTKKDRDLALEWASSDELQQALHEGQEYREVARAYNIWRKPHKAVQDAIYADVSAIRQAYGVKPARQRRREILYEFMVHDLCMRPEAVRPEQIRDALLHHRSSTLPRYKRLRDYLRYLKPPLRRYHPTSVYKILRTDLINIQLMRENPEEEAYHYFR
ncbi:MAG: hypothetical protein HYX24_02005 [Candidatus Aenigmarchaeota archaeon]|nr:hypothetical protein [Candidatus Aenigmarchaeota archaeon]